MSDHTPRTRELDEELAAATEDQQAELALRGNVRRLRFLDAPGKETAKSTDADVVLAITTRMLGEHLAVAVCAYADMDDDEGRFHRPGKLERTGFLKHRRTLQFVGLR